MNKCCDDELTVSEIIRIMEEEDYCTGLIKFGPASGGAATETGAIIRAGNIVTLSELFHYGSKTLSCMDLYKMWLSLPVFAYRRHRGIQGNGAQHRRNRGLHR